MSSLTLDLQPAAACVDYWNWRARRDLHKLDVIHGAVSALRVLSLAAAASSTGAAGALPMLLLLLGGAALAQLALARTHAAAPSYPRVRTRLLCVSRLLWSAYYWAHLRHARRLAPEQRVYGAVSWALQLLLQPLLQPLPFALQLPLQLGEVGLMAAAIAPVVRSLERMPALAGWLVRLGAHLEAGFHVSLGFVCVSPRMFTACGRGDVRVVAWFVVLYCSAVLPLYYAYRSELLSKARWCIARGATIMQHTGGGGSGSGSGGSAGAATAAAGAGGNRGGAGAGSSSAGSSAGGGDAAAAAASHSNSTTPAAPTLALVGAMQPIPVDLLAQLVHSPSARLRDGVVCSFCLFVGTWGLCWWVAG